MKSERLQGCHWKIKKNWDYIEKKTLKIKIEQKPYLFLCKAGCMFKKQNVYIKMFSIY